MNDDLRQLLQDADAKAPAPTIDVTGFPHRIRRTVRNQRRLAACGLAIGMVVLLSPLALLHHPTASPVTGSPVPIVAKSTAAKSNDLEIELLDRTVALLEAHSQRPQRTRDTPD